MHVILLVPVIAKDSIQHRLTIPIQWLRFKLALHFEWMFSWFVLSDDRFVWRLRSRSSSLPITGYRESADDAWRVSHQLTSLTWGFCTRSSSAHDLLYCGRSSSGIPLPHVKCLNELKPDCKSHHIITSLWRTVHLLTWVNLGCIFSAWT